MREVTGNLGSGIDLETLFREIDTDGSGTIDYGEFVTAAISKQTMLTQANIDMMFKLYDKDGNGEIDCAEFIEGMKAIQALEGSQNGEVWQ